MRRLRRTVFKERRGISEILLSSALLAIAGSIRINQIYTRWGYICPDTTLIIVPSPNNVWFSFSQEPLSYTRPIEATAAAATVELRASSPPRATTSDGVRVGGGWGGGGSAEGWVQHSDSWQAHQHQQQAEQYRFPGSDPSPAGIGEAGQWDNSTAHQVRAFSLSQHPSALPYLARNLCNVTTSSSGYSRLRLNA